MTFYFWDLSREKIKKYEVLYVVLFLVFLLFVVSETLLFVSFFWTSFHSPTILPTDSFYLTHPSELTFTNTLLLSNGGISLGKSFISLEISSSFFIYFSLFSFIHACTFISLQIKEFPIIPLSINDSLYGSLFFFFTGLHFFHLIIGLLLLSLLFWSYNFLFNLFILRFTFSFSWDKVTDNKFPILNALKGLLLRLQNLETLSTKCS